LVTILASCHLKIIIEGNTKWDCFLNKSLSEKFWLSEMRRKLHDIPNPQIERLKDAVYICQAYLIKEFLTSRLFFINRHILLWQ